MDAGRPRPEGVDPVLADEVDVAVVGCGPVGGVLAALLGRRGHRVTVVERHPVAYALPRAVHLDHEVARLLQGLGLGDDLREISEPGREYQWRNGAGQVLLRFGGRPVGPSGWPDSNMFWQPGLERRIEATAAALPTVEVRRGVSVADLLQDDHGATLRLRASDGTEEDLRARWAVGCDGAGSTVRDLLGVGVTDLGFFYDWLIVDVLLHRPRTFDPINVQVCEPSRPTTLVSGGPGRRRWEFMRLPHETVEELDDESRAWELLAPWDVTPDDATLERHAVYRFQARWADRWRTGRVLLAGDAAHQMPPFAGQGMCSGIRDAANLAWKLDLVLGGHAPDALLDAYERERAENVRTVIDLSMALGRVICITDPDEAAARDAEMAAAAVRGAQPQPALPGVTDGVVRSGDPVAGQLFVQGRVAAGGRTALLDDVVGAGWHLVTTAPAAVDLLADEDLAWLALVGGRVVTVGDDGLADVDGTYTRWFAEHGVIAVLQRPDLHLYGAAADPAGATVLLADLRAALTHPVPIPGGDAP